jgi:hypothetical protein
MSFLPPSPSGAASWRGLLLGYVAGFAIVALILYGITGAFQLVWSLAIPAIMIAGYYVIRLFSASRSQSVCASKGLSWDGHICD